MIAPSPLPLEPPPRAGATDGAGPGALFIIGQAGQTGPAAATRPAGPRDFSPPLPITAYDATTPRRMAAMNHQQPEPPTMKLDPSPLPSNVMLRASVSRDGTQVRARTHPTFDQGPNNRELTNAMASVITSLLMSTYQCEHDHSGGDAELAAARMYELLELALWKLDRIMEKGPDWSHWSAKRLDLPDETDPD